MKNYVTLQERIEEMNKNLHPAGDREEDGLDKAAEQPRWHTRWRAVLVDHALPNSSSRNWGGAISELTAVARVIYDLWVIIHRDNPDMECPFTDIKAVALLM